MIQTKTLPNRYILYWMQASQRVQDNQALNSAVDRANKENLPVMVLFTLTPFPEGNLRHYQFMVEGLRPVAKALEERGILFILEKGDPVLLVPSYAQQAESLFFDRGYLKIQRLWRKEIRNKVKIPLFEKEDNTLYPVEEISTKQEWSAYTLRKKIEKSPHPMTLSPPSFPAEVKVPHPGKTILPSDEDLAGWVKEQGMDSSLPQVALRGGEEEALAHLEEFITSKIGDYGEKRNNPGSDYQSQLAPYLHFGQISPATILGKLEDLDPLTTAAFREELIVRRELAINFCWYNTDYDQYWSIPDWARQTLEEHTYDERAYLYSPEELEQGNTHDIYWNAAQKEMVLTGKMHGYMRMYWGKKILEWMATPKEAYNTALYLNNKYSLDGRDPNSFAGVAWCFGLHDRPWKERPIFGKVRYMAQSGLIRKFSMEDYLSRISGLYSK